MVALQSALISHRDAVMALNASSTERVFLLDAILARIKDSVLESTTDDDISPEGRSAADHVPLLSTREEMDEDKRSTTKRSIVMVDRARRRASP